MHITYASQMRPRVGIQTVGKRTVLCKHLRLNPDLKVYVPCMDGFESLYMCCWLRVTHYVRLWAVDARKQKCLHKHITTV